MAWYNASWGYRKKITILATKVAADHTDFIVPIDLANLDSDFHTNVKSDGTDIRVTTSDEETEVPIDLFYYNGTTDKGLMAFKGTIDGDDNTDFYLYYGNAAASAYASPTDTYASEVKGWWWLGTDPTSGVADRTVNNNDLVHDQMESGNLNDETASCIGAKSISFAGGTSGDTAEKLYINSGDQTGLNISATGLFIGAIVYKDDDSPGEQMPLNKDDNSDGQYAIQMDEATNDRIRSISNWDDYLYQFSAGATNGAWHMMNAWWDGGTTAYLALNNNTASSSTGAAQKDMPDGTAGIFEIGTKDRYNRFWDGQICMAWVVQPTIASGEWDTNWRTTMYNAYMDNVNFYTEGDQEAGGGGATAVKDFISEGFIPMAR